MVFERKRSEVVVSYLPIYENIVIKTAFSGSGVTTYEPATSETGTPVKHLFGNLAKFCKVEYVKRPTDDGYEGYDM